MTKLSKKPGTKKEQLIRLLGTKSGCDIKSLSGLRKAGYEVVDEKSASGSGSKYRILATPSSRKGAVTAVESLGA